MPTIHIDVDPKPIRNKLNALSDKRSLQAVYLALADTLHAQVSLTFRTSKSPWGTPWKPLKRRAGKPLLHTGRLRQSINRRINSDATIDVGTNVIYGWTHQFGMQLKRKRKGSGTKGGTLSVPARPFLPIRSTHGGKPSDRVGKAELPDTWRNELNAVVVETIKDLLRR